MKIINPLYDNAFKYLMDNEQIAKSVLSIILGETVVSLQSKPQETQLYTDDVRTTARYDFKAIVRNNNNEERTILIELQKYKHPDPTVRFREYLAENYRKVETAIDSNGEEIVKALPIVTVYILGYKVTTANILAFQVERTVKDLVWGTTIEEKLDFVEQLTHDSYILQAGVKPEKKRGTRLEYFLSLFSQKLRLEESNYVIDVDFDESDTIDREMSEIVSHLNRATLNESILRSLKYEASYEKGFREAEQEVIDLKAENKKAKARAEKEKAEKEKERAEKEKERAEKEKERAEKELARKTIEKTVRELHLAEFSISKIAGITGLEESEISEILK